MILSFSAKEMLKRLGHDHYGQRFDMSVSCLFPTSMQPKLTSRHAIWDSIMGRFECGYSVTTRLLFKLSSSRLYAGCFIWLKMILIIL